ncbi:MAG: hypothetical protein F4195_08730 [Gammaproteobacteria bacterium]|nr:hypothetical protein [Gammaproteobacteria bacterium]
MAESYSIADARRTSFTEAYENFRQDADLAAFDFDPDELFADVRDKSSGPLRSTPNPGIAEQGIRIEDWAAAR